MLEEIKRMIEAGPEARKQLEEYLAATHPADLADILEQLEEEERKILFSLLPAEVASETLAETGESHQEELIESMDDETLQEVFEELRDDDATDIVQELSEQQAERVMRVIDVEDLEEIQTLMKYSDDSAGGVMTGELVSVKKDLTAAEAIEQVRQKGRDIQYFFTVYVVDEQNVDLLLQLDKGHIREEPLRGIGINKFINSPNSYPNLRNKVSQELQQDRYTLTLFYVDPETNDVNIDFN